MHLAYELHGLEQILDLVVREHELVVSSDVGHDERVSSGQSLALYNIRSVVAAPLKLHDDLKGVLYLHRTGAKAFSKADGDLVGALSSLLASGIGAAIAALNVLFDPAVPNSYYHTSLLAMVFGSAIAILNFACVGALVYQTIHQLTKVSRIHATATASTCSSPT